MLLQKADQMIWPIQQRLFQEDATPRNLVIGTDIADDRLYANIFEDGGGCYLHVVGEILEIPPVLNAQREVDRLDLQEVMAGLELGCGEGHNGAAANPTAGDLSDAARDVSQAGGDGVATGIHRPDSGGCCGMEGLDL